MLENKYLNTIIRAKVQVPKGIVLQFHHEIQIEAKVLI